MVIIKVIRFSNGKGIMRFNIDSWCRSYVEGSTVKSKVIEEYNEKFPKKQIKEEEIELIYEDCPIDTRQAFIGDRVHEFRLAFSKEY
jgi:hypothetical protein